MIYWLNDIIVPVVVGVTAFLLTDRVVEWRNRRSQSLLGVSVLESLLEEVNTGINIFNQALSAIDADDTNLLPMTVPPRKSWIGPLSISDSVLLRLVTNSKERTFSRFNPKDIRIHLKNYFDHMLSNYDSAFAEMVKRISPPTSDWKNPIINTVRTGGSSVEAAEGVKKMLEEGIELLRENSTKCWPK